MDGIKTLVIDLVETYQSVSEEQKKLFSIETVLGKCPHCGADIIKGKFGAYCKEKCGMNVSRAMGTVLSDTQIQNLLSGKRILMKGLKGKNGSYDAYLIPEGIEEFTYTKDNQKRTGYQYKFKIEFPKKKKQ